jgi:hypothetical protein
VVPDTEWLTPDQHQKLARFAASGGQVIPAAQVEKPGALQATLRDKSRILVDAPPSVAIELCQQENPARVLVHLVNYEPTVALKDIPIRLRLAGPSPTSARALSPEHSGGRRLVLKQEGDFYVCVLPELRVYAVVVIKGTRL